MAMLEDATATTIAGVAGDVYGMETGSHFGSILLFPTAVFGTHFHGLSGAVLGWGVLFFLQHGHNGEHGHLVVISSTQRDSERILFVCVRLSFNTLLNPTQSSYSRKRFHHSIVLHYNDVLIVGVRVETTFEI